jgi:hypothetical protein
MTALLTTNLEFDNFGFQDLQPMGSHPALIYIPGLNADPAHNIAAQNVLTVGDIYTNNNQLKYSIEVDAAQIGRPAVNVSIRLRASPLLLAVSVTISIERGQTLERRSGSGGLYLERYAAGFLCKQGGRGRMYDNDARPIQTMCRAAGIVALKKRILRQQGIICGVASYPDTFAVSQLLSRLPAGDPAALLINHRLPPMAKASPQECTIL